jgi:hypothetical protein
MQVGDTVPRPSLKYEHVSATVTRVATVDPAVGFQPRDGWGDRLIDRESNGEIDDGLRPSRRCVTRC